MATRQDNLIKLVTKGTEDGTGKGHIIYAYKNKKKIKTKLELMKFNPKARTHTLYTEKK